MPVLVKQHPVSRFQRGVAGTLRDREDRAVLLELQGAESLYLGAQLWLGVKELA
jgi:hypothetical protein